MARESQCEFAASLKSMAFPRDFWCRFCCNSRALVSSPARAGPAGGYQLVKPPDEITLGEVMSVIEGQETEVTSTASTDSPTARALVQVWREVAQVQHDALRAITFGDLVSRIKRQSENMFYI